MSAYSAIMSLYDNPVGSLYHYDMEEVAAPFANTGAIAAPLTANGVISPGTASFVPGDTGTCVFQTNKTTPMAYRAHNALLDVPGLPDGDPTKFTNIIWFRPTKLTAGGTSGYGLWEKVGTTAAYVRGIKIEATVQLDSGSEVMQATRDFNGYSIAADGMYMFASVFDGTARKWVIYLNGVEQNTRLYGTTKTPVWPVVGGDPAGRLWVGGHGGFGTTGIPGYAKRFTHLLNWALTKENIQNLYVLGLMSPSEIAGITMNVFPWSREVVAANPARTRLILTNDSDQTIYLRLSSDSTPATHGAGPVLRPKGDSFETKTWLGPVQAIHAGDNGFKKLTITEL